MRQSKGPGPEAITLSPDMSVVFDFDLRRLFCFRPSLRPKSNCTLTDRCFISVMDETNFITISRGADTVCGSLTKTTLFGFGSKKKSKRKKGRKKSSAKKSAQVIAINREQGRRWQTCWTRWEGRWWCWRGWGECSREEAEEADEEAEEEQTTLSGAGAVQVKIIREPKAEKKWKLVIFSLLPFSLSQLNFTSWSSS